MHKISEPQVSQLLHNIQLIIHYLWKKYPTHMQSLSNWSSEYFKDIVGHY